MTNHCGSCTACCRIFNIPELKKPAGRWCDHCAIGSGCKIYAERPKSCSDYECLWLLSQQRTNPLERMAPELRPDRSKVVITPTTNDNVFGAVLMPGAPDAWKRPAMHRFLANLVRNGIAISIGLPRATRHLLWSSKGVREIEMTEPDENGMQWKKEEA